MKGGVKVLMVVNCWHDVLWLGDVHLIGYGFALAVLGLGRFKISERLNIDQYTNRDGHADKKKVGLTENCWPIYALLPAGRVGTFLRWSWLLFLGSHATQVTRVLYAFDYLSCSDWCVMFFWGKLLSFGVWHLPWAALELLYIIWTHRQVRLAMVMMEIWRYIHIHNVMQMPYC